MLWHSKGNSSSSSSRRSSIRTHTLANYSGDLGAQRTDCCDEEETRAGNTATVLGRGLRLRLGLGLGLGRRLQLGPGRDIWRMEAGGAATINHHIEGRLVEVENSVAGAGGYE
ncbi:GL15671 [Drosophila persimilis]|uniref:GL15671 n=1 Tax=Drosophila persimilis TaxID=7234 RepID=B4H937_DROPE|nr:GL15671 [Drosophila persimilis]